MRTTRTERMRAEQVSAAVDQLLVDPGAQVAGFDLSDTDVVAAAHQLARLPLLLGPVDPILEQRVMQQVRAERDRKRRPVRFKPGLAVAGLAAVLLAVMLFTPLGQTAVASFMAVFDLGRTEVRITPVDTPSALPATAVTEGAGIQQTLTLEEARTQIPFAVLQPSYLPPGYSLLHMISHTYPELPAWIVQPLFVELVYGDKDGKECALQIYPIMLGDDASISGLNLRAAPIQDVQDVDVNGQPGVLLRLGSDPAKGGWHELVWEQDDLVLALSSADLDEEELLRIARSVR